MIAAAILVSVLVLVELEVGASFSLLATRKALQRGDLGLKATWSNGQAIQGKKKKIFAGLLCYQVPNRTRLLLNEFIIWDASHQC